jgi:hypothetical protein
VCYRRIEQVKVVLIISAILLSANPQSLPSRTPLAEEEQEVSGRIHL